MSTKKCRFCGEEIKSDALKCRYCREWVVEGRERPMEERIAAIMQAKMNTQTATAQPQKERIAAATTPQNPIAQPHPYNQPIQVEQPISREVAPAPITQVVPTVQPQATDHSKYMPQAVEQRVVAPERVATPERVIAPERVVTPQPVQAPREELYRSQPVHEERASNPLYTSQAQRQPVQEVEVDDEPRLRYQNFAINKVLSCVAMILLLLQAFFAYLIPEGGSVPVYMYVVPVATIAISIYLLSELKKYLQNFDIFDYVSNYLKVMLIGICIAVVGVGVFFFAGENAKMVLIGLVGLPLAIAYISALLVGWKLWKEMDDDYVDGLENLGMVMFISVFFPPLWVVVPYFLFKVFENAGYYTETYGYSEDY